MILDKLHKTKNIDGEVIWPWYRIFRSKLQLVKFKDVKVIHGTHNEFKQTVKNDLEKNGLLCPMVLDREYQLHSGNHRFKILKNLGDASLFYIGNNDAEVNFFSRLNVEVWKMHPVVNDLSFCFESKMRPYSEKCLHLFTDVRPLPPER